MDCYNCNYEMNFVRKVESQTYSLDIYHCPICESSAEVKGSQEDIERVLWERR